MSREHSSNPSSLADMALLGRLFEEHRPRLEAMLRRLTALSPSKE